MESLIEEQEQNSDNLPVAAVRRRIRGALHAVHGVTLLREVTRDRVGEAFLQLLRELAEEQPDAASVASAYSNTFGELALLANEGTAVGLSDAWQASLVVRLIADRNPWSAQVERVGSARVSPTL